MGTAARFATTHWSMVLAAGGATSTQASAALAELCRTYWYPLYAFLRHRGYSVHDAQDLTQEFFVRLVERRKLAGVTRTGGRFRSYLLAAMRRFLVDEWRRGRARKRGSGQVVLLDPEEAETRFRRESAESVTPERLFEQNWALAVLESVYEGLRREYEASGKAEWFEALKFCLTGDRGKERYAVLAERLGVSQNTVKSSVHRLRRRYRDLLRDTVGCTVADPAEVEDEMRYLMRVLGGMEN